MQIPSLGLRFLMRKLQPVSGGVWGLGKLMPTECSEQTQHTGSAQMPQGWCCSPDSPPSPALPDTPPLPFSYSGLPWVALTHPEVFNLPFARAAKSPSSAEFFSRLHFQLYSRHSHRYISWHLKLSRPKNQAPNLLLPLSSPLVFVNDITVYP